MVGRRSLIGTLFVVMLGINGPLVGQVSSSSGAIQGVVVDQTGAVLPDAKVTLTNKALPAI